MKPATSSDSASGRSNGGRFVSASAEMKKTTNIGNSGSQYQSRIDCGRPMLVPTPIFWALTISVRFKEPTQQQHGDDDEADGDFVGDHLGRRPERPHERILRVRGPATHDDAVDAERRDREQVEHADVEVRDDPAAIGQTEEAPLRHRYDRPRGEGKSCEATGARINTTLSAPAGMTRFLEDELQKVGERLQQAERADDVGALPHLHGRPRPCGPSAAGRRWPAATRPSPTR